VVVVLLRAIDGQREATAKVKQNQSVPHANMRVLAAVVCGKKSQFLVRRLEMRL
jgi:hypothetical protein